MVSGTISLPSLGCFSPFPHGTISLSVSQEYLALPDGPGRFTQDFSCPALLRIPLCLNCLRIRDYHPLWSLFPKSSSQQISTTTRSYYPGIAKIQHRFGLFPLRSPLLRESFSYFLFLGVLRCFSSPGLPHYLCSDTCPSNRWVVPFGNLRINGYLHLHAAYRSLSRPSSPLWA